MSKFTSDSFLPSSAINETRRGFGSRSDSMVSPMGQVPRSVPGCILSPSHDSPKTYLQSRSPSQHPNGPPISPPKTRSASADDSAAGLIEDWRAYTHKLRQQNEGERAHMMADRARMEEVMAKERELWDKERDIMKVRIVELEAQLEKMGGNVILTAVGQRQSATSVSAYPINLTSPGSNTVSVIGSTNGSSAKVVPQESGRNADGSPFYAPAPRNPSRTFGSSENNELRVYSITAPRESAIRVTSKELTRSDFGLQSPPELASIPEPPNESIDISHIQPELEGVPIKASAVSPTFAAKVLSPQYSLSPEKLSPNTKPPPRDVTNISNSLHRSGSQDKKSTLAIICAPENHRLTLHAGHTPNYSISKFDLSDSGNATPTQNQKHAHNPSMALNLEQVEEIIDEGPALEGPLGLTNDLPKDNAFLAALVTKLEDAKRHENLSPSEASTEDFEEQDGIGSLGLGLGLGQGAQKEESTSPKDNDDKGEDAKADDIPPLRLKPSFNFGRPMGSM
jgi:hypothetical protein